MRRRRVGLRVRRLREPASPVQLPALRVHAPQLLPPQLPRVAGARRRPRRVAPMAGAHPTPPGQPPRTGRCGAVARRRRVARAASRARHRRHRRIKERGMQNDKRAWLDRIKTMFAGFDKALALSVFLLLCVGIVTLYSARLDVPSRVEDQLRNILLTFVLMWAIANVPPQTLMRFAVPLYTFGIALLVAVALFGLTRKGAKRWINIGVVIQPSEILKIATPLMLAWYYQRREGGMRWYDYLGGPV